ncbi:MAG TPA: hypothetical protein VKT82_18610 [Ktedonobacterales bacterium]|nr:hypothetical protein [Ktedonobacterales bacterium]
MAHEVLILWLAWWGGATLLTLGWIVLNARRRRRISHAGDDELALIGLPTWRDDLLWGALVVVGGGVGLAVNLFLLKDGHTARGILASSIFGLIMLLGVLMVLKNGLAPTDVLRLDAQEPPDALSPDATDSELLERLKYQNARSDI